MKGWINKTIGELCDEGGGEVKTGPFGSQLHQSDYQDEGAPVVMPTDIIEGRIDVSRIVRVSESHVDRLHKHILSKGDIVYGRRGDIGRQALVRSENIGWLCGTGCLRISLGKIQVLPEFLHLYLSLPGIAGWVENQAVGATMPNLNTGILRRVPVWYPKCIDNQRKIASIVFTYDDLIENNKRRIDLLEKMAEEIYREWFVRMRFPGHEKVKVVKGVPVDWAYERASAFFSVVKGKSYGGDEVTENPSHMPFITLKSFNRGGGYREDGLKYYSGRYKDDQIVRADDIVMAVTDMTQNREVVGRVAKVPNSGDRGAVISLDVIKIVPRKVTGAFLYSYLRFSGFSECIKEFANGANVLHLKSDLVTQQKIYIPTMPLQLAFSEIVKPIYNQIDLLSTSNKSMTKMRDMLLPRLISGKLSVENLDIQLPPSMQDEASS